MAHDHLTQTIEALLKETGEAHRKAFIKTDGADPDWPLWYADHLKDKLDKLFDADFAKSEIINLLVKSEKERSL